ncbi:hypothetical protein [Jeotgalibacillus malaysiensis]|uniref:hypothetical protein n=1 Tax=Jeotgalibacillus malaysiensis TaxID=1508404 RepID=UPI003850DBCE
MSEWIDKGFLFLQFVAIFLFYYLIAQYIANRFLPVGGIAGFGVAFLAIIFILFATQLTTVKIKDINRSNP